MSPWKWSESDDGCVELNVNFYIQIDWSLGAEQIHNFIRGNDKVPGAWTLIDSEQVFYDNIIFLWILDI